MLRRLLVADLKMMTRNRQALFWALLFPIMFATIFGLFNFDQLPRTQILLRSDDSPAARAIETGLRQVPSIEFTRERYDTEAAARAAVQNGDLDFVIDVATDGNVTVLVNSSAADINRIFVPIFERVVDEINIRTARVERAFRLRQEAVGGHRDSYYDFVLPGLVGMAVMTYGIIGLGSTLAQYRGQRILRRILATPLKPRTFLLAIVGAHLVLACVQSLIVLGFGVLAFGGTVRGNLVWILLLVMLANLTFLNIGFMVAARADTAEAASGLGNAVSMPMMFFSGVFFPTTTLPWILPTLTSILPLHPLVTAIRSIALDATSITDHIPELAQLSAWALGTFLLASRVFRFERA